MLCVLLNGTWSWHWKVRDPFHCHHNIRGSGGSCYILGKRVKNRKKGRFFENPQKRCFRDPEKDKPALVFSCLQYAQKTAKNDRFFAPGPNQALLRAPGGGQKPCFLLFFLQKQQITRFPLVRFPGLLCLLMTTYNRFSFKALVSMVHGLDTGKSVILSIVTII